jgi:hypothetical protein
MNKLVVSIAFAIISSGFSHSIARADKAFRTGKGTAWDCKEDPVVSIAHGAGTYTFKGSCRSISLIGGNSTLTIESVESLSISGASNKITADSIGSISIVGSKNTVTYKSGLHGDAPSVSKVGTDNVVTGGGGGGGKADGGGPSAGSKPSSGDSAGAQDCAKNPAAVIDNGEGNYKFVGPCTKIVVNGGENTLDIESVKEINVNGSTNTVTIGSVDKIGVTGSENKVSYRKGLSGPKPRIGSIGAHNSVTQLK